MPPEQPMGAGMPGAPMTPPAVGGPPPTIAYGAEIPIEERLSPETTFHSKILGRINSRLDLSSKVMTLRYGDWDRVNDTLRMFVDLSRKALRGDRTEDTTKREMPFERAIVIPATFAIHQVRKTQLASLFVREPIFQIVGRSPDDIESAQLMEAAVDYDADQTRADAVLYNFLQDADRYGVGIIHDCWEEEPGWVTEYPAQRMGAMQQMIARVIAPASLQPQRVPGIVREFNRWTNVDPYNFWPDPRVPVAALQTGEFIGHRTFNGRMSLLERTVARGGSFFNIEKLEKHAGQASRGQYGGQRRSRFNTNDFMLREGADEKDRGFYAIDHWEIKLIPREWELGEGDAPEIWWFAVADESVIIRAHKSAYEHGKFNYSAGETLPDPYEILNPGMVEQLDGLQRVIDWLWNSRIANIRRSINNSMIWSTVLFEEADVLHPNAAGSIRLTQKAEELLLTGQLTIPQMWSQLLMQDLTGSHAQAAGGLFEMMQRMSAASDPAMSQPTAEKRTLGEIQSMLAAASQQMMMVARMIDSQAIRPLAERAMANRQQFTSMEQWFKVTGDLAKTLTGATNKVQVNRTQLQGNFDYIANSGTMPSDPARQAELWLRMGEIASKTPALQQPGPDGKMLDIRKIFNEGIRAAGIRNIESFYVDVPPPQIMPDAALAAGVQAGNIVPMPGQAPGMVA